MPDGWAVIGRCRFGTGVPGPHATGCYALAHPKVGVALIDIVPNATPNAEARLRRALTAVEFWPDFPGTLPVVHDRLDAAALRSLPWVLGRWFSALPALTVPGGSAWIEGVRRAMAVDPAWELPGHPKVVPDAAPAAPGGADDDMGGPAPKPTAAIARASSARPRRWGRLAALPVAFVAVFALGLVSGFLLWESHTPAGSPAVAAAPPQASATPAQLAALPEPASKSADAATAAVAAPAEPVEAPKQAVETTAASLPAPTPEPAPASATVAAAQPPSSRPEPPPLAAQSPTPAAAEALALQAAAAAGPALGGVGPMPAQSFERRVSHATPIEEALPMAPPRAPAPPVKVSSQQPSGRPSPVIDRACSQALFRFQQGERLTAAEQNFIRTGCSTARR